ncbi:flagellar basal body P-ring formation chaperone FlgA [Thalassotalea euphylliae]|uniref:flagellar basal body P-ring formation chaperone FlgA n=1 Tax=Thalassotalea euphylliae TaxID=1655234 RepID=UPI0036329241
MSKTKIFLTFLFMCCQLLTTTVADTYDREYVENLAHETAMAWFATDDSKHVSVEVSKLDPRIIIKPCAADLVANIPENHSSRNVNIKISCVSSTPWQMYVPVRVKTMVPVVIANQTISKGSMLTEDNVEVAMMAETKVRGERVTDLSAVIGAKSQRNISKGRNITRRNICIVCKGDSVTLVAKNSILQIKTTGTSISSGHLGDNVKVRNDRSGKLVTGQITGLNKVTINL